MNVGKLELLKLLKEQNFYTPSRECFTTPRIIGQEQSFENINLSNQKSNISPSISYEDSSLERKTHSSNSHKENMIVETPRSLKQKILAEIKKNDELEKTISILPFLSSQQQFTKKTSYLQLTSSSSSSTESSILCETNHASNNGDYRPSTSEIKCYREKKIEEDIEKKEKKDESLTGLIKLLKEVFVPSGENEKVLEAASIGMTERICFDNEISERVIEAMSLNHSAAMQIKTQNHTNVQFKTFETRMVKHESETKKEDSRWEASQEKHMVSELKNAKEKEALRRNEMNAKGDYKKTKKEKHSAKGDKLKKIIQSKERQKVKDSNKNSFAKLFTKSDHKKKSKLRAKKHYSKTKKKRKKSSLTTNERIHLLLDELLQQPNQDIFLEKLVKSLEMLHDSPPLKPDTFIAQLSESFNLKEPILMKYPETKTVFVTEPSDCYSPSPSPRKSHKETFKISNKEAFLTQYQQKHQTKQKSSLQMPVELKETPEEIKLEPEIADKTYSEKRTSQPRFIQLSPTQNFQPPPIQNSKPSSIKTSSPSPTHSSQPAPIQTFQPASTKTSQPSPIQTFQQTLQTPVDQNAIQLLLSILSSSQVQISSQLQNQSNILPNSDVTSMLLQTLLQLLAQQQMKQTKIFQNNSQQTINQTFESLQKKELSDKQDTPKQQNLIEMKNQKIQVSQTISKACNIEASSLDEAKKKIEFKKHTRKESPKKKETKHMIGNSKCESSSKAVSTTLENTKPEKNHVGKTPKTYSSHRNKETIKTFSSHNDLLSIAVSPADTSSLISGSQDSALKPPYVYPRKKPPSQKSEPSHQFSQKPPSSLTESSLIVSNKIVVDSESFKPLNFSEKFNLQNPMISSKKPLLPTPSKEIINLTGVVLNTNSDTPEPKKTIIYNKVSRAETWSEMQVLKWLILHNLKNCVKPFQKHKIDGKILLSMNKEAIDGLQLGFWTTHKLQKSLKELRKLMKKEVNIRMNGANQ